MWLQGKCVRWKKRVRRTKESKERDIGGCSSEDHHLLYQVFNISKYETGAWGVKSVLCFLSSKLFISLKAPLTTVRPIAKGGVSHVYVILPNTSDRDTDWELLYRFISALCSSETHGDEKTPGCYCIQARNRRTCHSYLGWFPFPTLTVYFLYTLY